MAEYDVILSNNSGSNVTVDDLGWVIFNGETVEAATTSGNSQFTFGELSDSDSLRALVSAGVLVVNDGSSNLSAADGVAYLTKVNTRDLEADFATQSDVGAVQDELNATQAGAGLGTDGSHVAKNGSNYIDAATSIAEETELLDSRAKANADAIAQEVSDRQNDISGLQDEVDATQAGAGLDSNGGYSADPTTNFLGGASDLKDADKKLDAEIQQNRDNLAQEILDRIAADGTKVNKSGDTMTGDLDMGTNKVTSSAAPQDAFDLVNKGYVEGLLAGLDPKDSVRVLADITDLPAFTYDNGVDGVGATITADANGAFPVTDDITVVTNDRIAIWEQHVGHIEAGLYDVTDAGSGSTPFILTRAEDANSNTNLSGGANASVEIGTVYAGSDITLIFDGNVDVGTDPILFSIKMAGSASIAGLQAEVDAVEAAVGLDSNGDYIGRTGSNYIDGANSIAEETELLDAQAKQNADNIDAILAGTLGDIAVSGGQIFARDVARNKWMGDQHSFIFGKAGRVRRRYLKITGGMHSNNSGIRIPKNMTIVAISAQLDSVGSADFEVRKNDGSTAIATLNVTSSQGAHATNLNVDVAGGEYLQVYCNNTTTVEDPVINIVCATNGGSL